MGDFSVIQTAALSVDEQIAFVSIALEREADVLRIIHQEGCSAHIRALYEAHEVLRDRVLALLGAIAAQRSLDRFEGGANG